MSNLFGSTVRAGVLETLAHTSAPLSGYRVARTIGAEPIQVLTILKALGPDLVQHTPQGWILVDDRLRLFLRARLRRDEAAHRSEKDALLVELGMTARRPRGRR